MRLLNIHSYTFREFHGENIPPYLIASHRWCDDETTFKDVLKKRNRESKGWQKVEGFCERARQDNELLKSFENATCCEWIWIDTACIDKQSSAEVSESINSMFEWYSKAQECHAYLADVKPFPASQQLSEVLDDFKNSEWFKRGWTLQELLAPRCVVFFTKTWQIIGHKCSDCSASRSCEGAGPLLNALISEVTGIPEEVLRDFERSKSLSVGEKIQWQVARRTTKIEDKAYCLLGLFDVHMPLLYGEGEKAMLRLERTVCEELGRPWQSQLRLSFDGMSQAPDLPKSFTAFARSARPLAIMRYSDVEGEVSCICGYTDDDGALVACDICQYWQHIACYFPEAGQHQALSENQEHRCVRCCPREVDIGTATSQQRQNRSHSKAWSTSLKIRPGKDACLKRSAEEDDAAKDGSPVKRLRTVEGDHASERTTTFQVTTSFPHPVDDLNQQATLSDDQSTLPPSPTDAGIAGVQHQQEDLDIDFPSADPSASASDAWYRQSERHDFRLDSLAGNAGSWSALDGPHPFASMLEHRAEPGSTFANPSSMKSAWYLPSTALPHVVERAEKCPIPTCEYSVRGFARKADKHRHILTHYRGEMICEFCDVGTKGSVRIFNRADVFKRHLIAVHGAEQFALAPRGKSSTSALCMANTKPSSRTFGQCSTCFQWSYSPQEFYDHIDGCVLYSVRQQHDMRSYICPREECASAGVAFKYRKDLERHTRARHGESKVEEFSCLIDYCAEAFTRKNDLFRHQRVMHGMDVNRRMHGTGKVEVSVNEDDLDT